MVLARWVSGSAASTMSRCWTRARPTGTGRGATASKAPPATPCSTRSRTCTWHRARSRPASAVRDLPRLLTTWSASAAPRPRPRQAGARAGTGSRRQPQVWKPAGAHMVTHTGTHVCAVFDLSARSLPHELIGDSAPGPDVSPPFTACNHLWRRSGLELRLLCHKVVTFAPRTTKSETLETLEARFATELSHGWKEPAAAAAAAAGRQTGREAVNLLCTFVALNSLARPEALPRSIQLHFGTILRAIARRRRWTPCSCPMDPRFLFHFVHSRLNISFLTL